MPGGSSRIRSPGVESRGRRASRVGTADPQYAGQLTEILRQLADAGAPYAAPRLAELLGERGDIDELRARANTGDKYAAMRLAEQLAERGDDGQLLALAEVGDGDAASLLAQRAAATGDLDALLCLIRAGYQFAGKRLVETFREQGRLPPCHTGVKHD
jgi:hypothetical protein